jgi:menaquinone-dependent protoporphyrinogen oxidase
MPTPRVLVAYASKHGSTAGIADVIADTLRDAGLRTDVETTDRIGTVVLYDAVILGSAVYSGGWQRSAIGFGERFAPELWTRPTWLFSSGPIGEPATELPVDPPRDARRLADRIHSRGHAWFGGALLPGTPGFIEGLMLRGGSGGDYRDLDRVRAWAGDVAAALTSVGEPIAVV